MVRLKKLGAALVVVAALGAVLASSALAAAVTQDVEWFTGPGRLGAAEGVGTTQVGGATLFTEIEAEKYELKWTGTECIECKIENAGGAAVGSGKLRFTGVAVAKPAGCKVANEITTKALSLQADWMKALKEEPNYWKFVPTAGGAFATFEIVGCAPAVGFSPKGIVFFKTTNPTEVQAVEQEVTTTEAINTAASGAAGALHVGAKPAELTLALKFKMARVPAEEFGTH